MALLLLESFDWIDTGVTGTNLTTHLGDRKLLSYDLTSNDDASTVSGIGGNGTALRLREFAHNARWPLSKTTSATDEVGMGIWFRLQSPTTSNFSLQNLFGLVDSNTTQFQINVYMLADNRLAMYLNTSVHEQLNISLTHNQWHFVEYKTVINDTTGSWEIRLDGVSIGSATGVDTKAGGNGVFYAAEIGGVANGANGCDFAGIVAWDDQGGDLTDFPGPVSFKSLHPDADGDDEDWTTSSGTDSYLLVNETAPHDDDSDYVESSTTGNRDLFTYDNLSTSYTGVIGIQINTVARETDASDFTLINTFKQNSTLYPESSQAIAGQTYESLFNVLDLDPDTSLAWTVSGINSVQAGIEVG